MACSHDDQPMNDQYKYNVDDAELHDDFSYDCDDEPDASSTEPDRRSGSVDRAGVLAAIGYRPDSLWQAAAGSGAEDACERCGRKVYPVERVDIGVIYHRGCFRCRVCNLQLTLKTFLASEEMSADGTRRTRVVYCSVHLPKQTRGHITGDAVGIRFALEAQRRATAKGQKSMHEPGWNFNPNTPCTGEYEQEQQQQLQQQYEQVQQMEQTREEQQQLQDEYQQLQQRKQQQEERMQRLKEQQRQLQQEQQEQQQRLQQQQEMLQQQAHEQLMLQRQQQKQQEERTEKRQQMQKAQQEQQQKQLKIQQQEEQLNKQHELLALQQQQMKQQQQDQLMQQQQFEEQQRSLREQRQKLQQLREIQEQQQIVLQQQQQQQLQKQQQQQKELQEQQQKQQQFEQQQQHQQPQTNTPTSQNSGTLKSYKDFETHGVFDAQAALEEKHRQEEDALYRQIFDDRKNHVANMERRLAAEKEKTVRELNIWFDKRGASAEERREGMKTLDEYFKSERERRVQQLMQRLAAEEEAAVARMVEKHSQEMLRLISDKEKGLKENDGGDDSEEGEGSTGEEEEERGREKRKHEYASSASTLNSSKSSVDREDMFGECDTLAIREAGREHTTFTGLVRNLSKRCANEMQKLRAIFRWITVKNLNQLRLDESHPSESPLGLLRGIQLGTESYHTLFKRLCSYAGLQCEVIDGYSKGAGYRPGMRLQGKAFRNQWTAVWVDGAWRFVNCNWGARHVTGRAGVSDRLTYKCDEFYFLTDPAEHIYQHFPDDDTWQLLKKPIKLAQFIRLPLLKSPFFNARLSLVAPQCCAMRTDTGSANFHFRVRTSVRLDATLRSPSKDGTSTSYDDRMYIRQVDDQVVCAVALPRPGGYFVDVYVTSSWEPDTMDLACVFRVRCTATLPNWMSASFPPGTCFGRTPLCSQLGLAEQTHPDPYIEHKGELVVAFSLAADVRLSHTLQRWSSTNRSLTSFDRHALLNHKDDNLASYVIRCPRSGSYVFSVYAASCGGQAMPAMACIYRYLLRCLEPGKSTSAMPQASTRWHHCRLVEPMVGDLPANARVRFTVDSAVAMEMLATVNQGGWQALEKTGQLWQGTINTGSEQGKLMMYGRFDPTREKYVPLMEYRVFASS